jgi:hypothetical protein
MRVRLRAHCTPPSQFLKVRRALQQGTLRRRSGPNSQGTRSHPSPHQGSPPCHVRSWGSSPRRNPLRLPWVSRPALRRSRTRPCGGPGPDRAPHPAAEGLFQLLHAPLQDLQAQSPESEGDPPHLRSHLWCPPNPAHSLGAFGQPATDTLAREALSEDAARRNAACWALGSLGGDGATALLSVAASETPEVRGDALPALARTGDPRARAALEANLDHRDGRVAA